MSEFMGLIRGAYDAKVGFRPGGSTLHNFMTPHGPDAATFEKASTEEAGPVRYPDTMAFMFETSFILSLAPRATVEGGLRDKSYQSCWGGLENNFVKEE